MVRHLRSLTAGVYAIEAAHGGSWDDGCIVIWLVVARPRQAEGFYQVPFEESFVCLVCHGFEGISEDLEAGVGVDRGRACVEYRVTFQDAVEEFWICH